jgi:P-type E1-E2 ATPase
MNFMPLSLIVTVDLIKYLQSKFIQWDASMISRDRGVQAKVNQSSLTDDLGQISHVFSDKTGTITKNRMIFRKMSIGGVCYGKNE